MRLGEWIEVEGRARPTRNSEGHLIAVTQEGVRNFWLWFGDSKIVDDQGRPQVCFHGTRSSFDSFRRGLKAANPWLLGEDNQHGFFFSSDPGRKSDSGPWSGASGYAGTVQREGETVAFSGANVMPVYLALEMPYRLSASEYRRMAPRPDFGEEIAALGYDGLACDDGTFVALDPCQIKSALGNSGRFNRDSPSVTDGESFCISSDAFVADEVAPDEDRHASLRQRSG